MAACDMKVSVAIPFTWSHTDDEKKLPTIEWCRWNGDGTFYVNWKRAEYIANLSINNDMQQTMQIMMAKLLVGAFILETARTIRRNS